MSETGPTSAGPDGFRCNVRRNGSSAWVIPVGELDLETVHHVEEALSGLRADGYGSLVLDLRGLTFMDSTGLRLAIRWDTAAREGGFSFAIVPGTDVVQRVFRVTGMDEHLRTADPAGQPEA